MANLQAIRVDIVFHCLMMEQLLLLEQLIITAAELIVGMCVFIDIMILIILGLN